MGTPTQMVQTVPVTVYLRTLNAERCLPQVLQAAQAFADEILIVDSGSTDATLDIAKTYGAKVVHQAWLGWGFQKRVAEDAARNDWVLDIDADEVVTPEMAGHIRKLFANGPPKLPVYLVRHTQVFPSGKSYNHAAVRYRAKLYDRRAIRIPAHVTWDQFKVPRGMKAGKLPGALLHYGFDDFGQLVRKQEGALTKLIVGLPKVSQFKTGLKVLTIFPLFFLKKYVQQGLWRAGIEGFSYSMICAFSSWLKHVKIYERDWITKAPVPMPLSENGRDSEPAQQRRAA